MKLSDLNVLSDALRECRKQHRLTQEQLGEGLGLSRKTYHLFENGQWLPPEREHAHFVRRLSAYSNEAAAELAKILGETLDAYGIRLLTPEQEADYAKIPTDAQAKLVFHDAIYATAEELDVSPDVVRLVANGVLQRLVTGWVNLAQAVTFSGAAAAQVKKKRKAAD